MKPAPLALRRSSEMITCTKHRGIAWASGSLGARGWERQGLGASGAPHGVWQGRARSTAPVREEGRLGMEVRVRPESHSSKPIVMRQVWGHDRKSAHGSGLGFGSVRCMARHRHGCEATQHGPRARAAEMQLPREGMMWGVGGWPCLRLLPALPPMCISPQQSEPGLDTCTISVHRQLNS